jgi:hypothetical protein
MRLDQPHGALDDNGDGSGVDDDVPAPPPALDETRAQADPFGEVFGNPFRPAILEPAWRTAAVLSTPRGSDQSRDFSVMPILGDALLGAGCENPDILGYCHGSGPHVRGCWVIDLLLGRE